MDEASFDRGETREKDDEGLLTCVVRFCMSSYSGRSRGNEGRRRHVSSNIKCKAQTKEFETDLLHNDGMGYTTACVDSLIAEGETDQDETLEASKAVTK